MKYFLKFKKGSSITSNMLLVGSFNLAFKQKSRQCMHSLPNCDRRFFRHCFLGNMLSFTLPSRKYWT